MTNRIVGVDIGSDSIRAVQVDGAHTSSPVITGFGRIGVPPGLVESGEVVQVDAVAALLTELWSAAGLRSKRVVLGVGNSRVLVRELTVPRGTARQVRQSLPFHVQDLLAVPASDTILDFYPVSEGVDDGVAVLSGLLVAAVSEAVTANIAAARGAGLTVVDVDLVPFALVRLQAASFRSVSAAFVDIGARSTTVVVATRGVPQFVRIIPTGGHDLTRLLSERLGIPPAEAEQVKREVGLVVGRAPAHRVAASVVINDFTNDLLLGVRNTLRYFGNAHPDRRLDGIVVSGGGARLSGLPAALAEITKLPELTAVPFAGTSFADADADTDADADADRVAGASPLDGLGVALGLARTSGTAPDDTARENGRKTRDRGSETASARAARADRPARPDRPVRPPRVARRSMRGAA
jgi:type IV pilus assembly protein PilM